MDDYCGLKGIHPGVSTSVVVMLHKCSGYASLDSHRYIQRRLGYSQPPSLHLASSLPSLIDMAEFD